MKIEANTIKEYLAALPEDRRKTIEAIRKVISKNIDKAFQETMQYGMPSYCLPHSKYPAGYHCDPKQPLPFASIASQKNHIGLYLFCVYCSPEETETFSKEWIASGKKLDMGKSCVRVKTLEDIPLDVLGRCFKRMTAKKFVAMYEAQLGQSARAGGSKKKVAKKKASKKKATKKVAKKAASKKVTAKKKAPRK